MNKYISQLIDDIKSIVNDDTDTKATNMESFVDIDATEQFLNGNMYELQQILGISKEALPPENKLSDKQISKLLPFLHELFEHHNYELAYPTELVDRTKYKLLYDIMETKHPETKYGRIGLEFCDYNIDECPIPGECDFCEQELKHESDEILESAIDDIDITELLPEGVKTEHESKLDEQHIRETVRSFSPNKKNIEGIFNYCDRWCERCLFIDKCTNFEMEKKMGMHENQSMEDALKYVGIMFDETGRMIEEDMKKFGIDINNLSDIEDKSEDKSENKEKHPLEGISVEYMKKVSDWLELNKEFISENALHLWNISQKKYEQFDEIFNVIGWHMTMIPVKINRVLKPRTKYDDDEFYETDKNATGKLVLECIDKSTQAFVLLLEFSLFEEDELIEFLAILSQLKKGIEKALPKAKNYKRIGLDD